MEAPRPLYLVAVDGSAPSGAAATYAFALAKQTGARLRVVTVKDIGLVRAEAAAASAMIAIAPSVEDVAIDAIAKASLLAAEADVRPDFAVLSLSDPSTALVADAKACGASLIIVGSHGRTGISRALLGSVAERVVRHAHCPVLVVRG